MPVFINAASSQGGIILVNLDNVTFIQANKEEPDVTDIFFTCFAHDANEGNPVSDMAEVNLPIKEVLRRMCEDRLVLNSPVATKETSK